VAVGRDVTQEMALQAQLRRAQKLESLGLLASGIAHDFNNVMSLVLGSAERIRQLGAAAPEMDRYVDMIVDAVKRGQSVSRRMLAIYKDRESRSEVFDVAMVIDDLAEVGRHTYPRNIRIEVSRCAGRSAVRGDRSQIHQALMNICMNAVGAMPKGGVLTLCCRPARPGEAEEHLGEARGRYVCVDVIDTGTGMDSDTVERIFDPYFSTKTTGHGTGLGLPISFGVVKAQGGWVHVRSSPGKGSVFTVGLAASLEGATEEPAETEAAPPRGKGERILVVDDEEGIRLLIRESLEAEGYEILEADDGVAALEVLDGAAGRVDGLVTDLGMAEMGGAELLRRVREVLPDLPVVVTTGYIDPSLTERLQSQGVTEVLSKPFRMVELLSALARAIRARPAP
jgi:nitrogen-specific signal transduction histidine kinase/ActR/RegA family two-component response regulator